MGSMKAGLTRDAVVTSFCIRMNKEDYPAGIGTATVLRSGHARRILRIQHLHPWRASTVYAARCSRGMDRTRVYQLHPAQFMSRAACAIPSAWHEEKHL